MSLDFQALECALERVTGFVVRTPVLESPLLNARLGFRLLLKAECLQHTGSFKLRGAYHAISRLSEAQRAQGVIAFSSGNHAQAVACVARYFGIAATIVMPADAPVIKRVHTEQWGARVILYNRSTEDREAITARLLKNSSARLIKPFDDPGIILGQGTAMLEAMQDCTAMNAMPERVYAPCSGGGLLSGSSIATAEYGVAMTACEPLGFQSVPAALKAGRPAPAYTDFPAQSDLCDALLSPIVGEHCYPLIARNVAHASSVEEDEVLDAMRLVADHFKIIVEPGGVAGVAAALQQKEQLSGKTVLAVLSGGNVDASVFMRALYRSRPSALRPGLRGDGA